MASAGEAIFEWAVGFVDECAAAGVELPPQLTRMLPYVDVVLWVRLQRTPLTWQQLSERWGVHRATAFRWLRVLRARPAEAAPALLPSHISGTAWYQGLNRGPNR